MRAIFCFIFVLFVFCTPAWGQENEQDTIDIFQLSLEELAKVTITTASKFDQSIEDAPNTVSFVTRDQILKYGWVSGNEVLCRLPGFSLSQDYERQTISARGSYEGWNNNHILMLIDGMPVNDNTHSTALTWEITPLVFVRSIEVVRGPGSALYGSSATNGIIAYNTLDAKDLKGKTEVRFRAGNMHTYITDVLVGRETEDVSFVSAFNHFETKGNAYTSFDASASRLFTIRDPRSSFYLFNKIKGKGKFAGLSFQYHEQWWSYSTGHGWLFFVPDEPEHLRENKRLLSLQYKTPGSHKTLQQEYLIRYQRYVLDANVRFFPNNTMAYPFGMTEFLATHSTDIFARAQWSYTKNKSVLLGGIENTVFLYGGDDWHTSNAYLDTDYSPTPNNETVAVGEFMSWIKSNPVLTTGIFAQYTSPRLWDKIQATVGVRYDRTSIKLNAIDVSPNAKEQMSFEKMSPRFSLVYALSQNITLKAMGGRAFRSPSPTELFSSNTFFGASNPRNLRPEVITTYELGVDWRFSSELSWRLNTFNTQFDDQIAYSVSNFNLSTNLYKQNTWGVESEFLLKQERFEGFLNYSYAQRVDEEIVDPTIAVSKSQLTWVPNHLANIALAYTHPKYYLSLQVHYQGSANRRSSDRSDETDAMRGDNVKDWTTVEAKATYKLSKIIEIGVIGTNLFDKKGMLIKNNLYVFDYQIPGRRILIDLRLSF